MTLSTTARRLAAALAVPLFVASAAACGSGAEDGKPGAAPAVTGEDGKMPQIADGVGSPPDHLQTKVLEKGKGRTVQKNDFLIADYAGQTWEGKAFDNSYKRKKPTGFMIGNGSVVEGWDKGLVGKKVGSKVELVIPPDMAYGDQPPQGSGIKKGDTLVFVIEIKDSVPTLPKGKKTPQTDASLPKIGTNTDHKSPSITVPKGQDAPDELVSRTVIQGDGKTVGKNDTVLAEYRAVPWEKPDQSVVDTWTGNPQAGAPPKPQESPLKAVLGWEKGLVGKKVGSRVMLAIPKSEFPEAAQKKAFDVVMVVDILRAHH
ncbi:MAG TPA: FKBP-type peptidyl-prolyl cis-trans isomerase [Streptomyces sp.]|jgi:FKBP-type peptidyl-prolyl cis-trans isomerase|nr:FKBP-type peptidyl-prolyl cis-trans isomerase [Streptomyces sp.]